MLVRVTALTKDKLVVILLIGQCSSHIPISNRQAAENEIDVISSGLQKYANRFGLGPPDHGRVIVPTPNVHEAAAVADDVAKCVRTLPSYCEGANATGAFPANASTRRIIDDPVAFSDLREQFINQKTRILITEGVIFEASIIAATPDGYPRSLVSGIDKEPDGYRLSRL